MRKQILDFTRVFSRGENHFRHLSNIWILFHHLFISYSRSIMIYEFGNKLLIYHNLLLKHERCDLEWRRFSMNPKFFHQIEVNWPFKTIEKILPTVKSDSRKKVNPIVLQFVKINKKFSQKFQVVCRDVQGNLMSIICIFSMNTITERTSWWNNLKQMGKLLW